MKWPFLVIYRYITYLRGKRWPSQTLGKCTKCQRPTLAYRKSSLEYGSLQKAEVQQNKQLLEENLAPDGNEASDNCILFRDASDHHQVAV